MKKVKKIVALIALITVVICLFGCGKKVQTFEESVVITMDAKYMPIGKDSVLLDYMKKLKEDNQIDFTITNGFISSINGIEDVSGTKYWMVYTDDSEFSNKEWGEIVVNGKTYYSASLGAESLPIKDGKTYVWGLVSFG